MIENNEISEHQAKIYDFVRKQNQWLTNADITEHVGFSARTVRLHTKRLVDLGIFELAELYPGHQFKLAPKPRDKVHLQRLLQAVAIFSKRWHTGQPVQIRHDDRV
jgi:hypothetical protein